MLVLPDDDPRLACGARGHDGAAPPRRPPRADRLHLASRRPRAGDVAGAALLQVVVRPRRRLVRPPARRVAPHMPVVVQPSARDTHTPCAHLLPVVFAASAVHVAAGRAPCRRQRVEQRAEQSSCPTHAFFLPGWLGSRHIRPGHIRPGPGAFVHGTPQARSCRLAGSTSASPRSRIRPASTRRTTSTADKRSSRERCNRHGPSPVEPTSNGRRTPSSSNPLSSHQSLSAPPFNQAKWWRRGGSECGFEGGASEASDGASKNLAQNKQREWEDR